MSITKGTNYIYILIYCLNTCIVPQRIDRNLAKNVHRNIAVTSRLPCFPHCSLTDGKESLNLSPSSLLFTSLPPSSIVLSCNNTNQRSSNTPLVAFARRCVCVRLKVNAICRPEKIKIKTTPAFHCLLEHLRWQQRPFIICYPETLHCCENRPGCRLIPQSLAYHLPFLLTLIDNNCEGFPDVPRY